MRATIAVFLTCILSAGCLVEAQGVRTTNQPLPRPKPQPQPAVELSITGAGQALTRVTSDRTDELYAAPSPDGKWLLFQNMTFVLDGNGKAVPKEIVIAGVDPETGARRTVYTSGSTFALAPAWMSDGKGFVFTSNAMGTWCLVRSVSNAPNAALTVIVNGEVVPEASNAAISPDGKRIAFSTRMRAQRNLAVAALDGSQLTLLGEGDEPAWSPDGKRLAFTRRVNGNRQLFTVDAETGTALVQVTTGEFEAAAPDWSPDGKLLVFDTNRGWNTLRGGNPQTTWNLYVVRPDGTGLTQLTSGIGVAQRPAWSRDGWIYFESNQAGNYDIWRLRPADDVTAPPVTGASVSASFGK